MKLAEPGEALRQRAPLLRDIADRVGTPVYVYDGALLDAGVARWTRAVPDPADVHYSVKANSNLGVLRHLAHHGIGFEVATPGELARVLAAGVDPGRIVFGGVPKDAAAVRSALDAGIDLLVLQAGHEFAAAADHGSRAGGGGRSRMGGKTGGRMGGNGSRAAAPVRVAIRVRPGIRAGAHPSLETGRADAKFGAAPDEVAGVWRRLAAAPGLDPCALAIHLGSGLDDTEPYERALGILLSLADELAAAGGPPVRELDLGGGLGVDYDGGNDPDPAGLVARIGSRLTAWSEGAASSARQNGARTPLRIRYEPGRSVVARAGLLLTRVLYRRERNGAPALVCDAGSTDFSRYALYRAQHRIEPLDREAGGETIADVLGPTCESGDVLATHQPLSGVTGGDLLALRDVGAYGFVMASNYNSRPRPAEVLIEDDGWRVVRAREELVDLWRGEVV